MFDAIVSLFHNSLYFALLAMTQGFRRKLDTAILVMVAGVVVQDVRFYRDLNSDRWIQSPEC